MDLVRDQKVSHMEDDTLMSRQELAHARLVIVVIGPASTKPYQVKI